MRRILLLFLLVLLVFTSISYANNHYRIVVYPGPGNTTVVFNDASSYEIQYDMRYNISLPSFIDVYEVNITPSIELNDYIAFIEIGSYNITKDNTLVFDEYGRLLRFEPMEYGKLFVEIPYVEAGSSYIIYVYHVEHHNYRDLVDLPYFDVLLSDDFINDKGIYEQYTTGSDHYEISDSYMYKVGTSDQVYVWTDIISFSVTDNLSVVEYGEFKKFADVGFRWYNYTTSAVVRMSAYIVYDDYTKFEITNYDGAGSSKKISYYTKGKLFLELHKPNRDTIKLYVNGSYIDYLTYSPNLVNIYWGIWFVWYDNTAKYDYYAVIKYYNSPKLVSQIIIDSMNDLSYSVKKLYTSTKQDIITNSNGLYAIMASRYKSWFGLGDGLSYPVRIVYDSGFTFYVGSTYYGGGIIGYDNDYFLYRIKYLSSEGWSFYIDDFYTGQYLSKTTGDNSIFTFNETYITEPYLFYIVFAPYRSDYVIIRIRAPPNYYVDNVTVQYMYAYYQNDNVYIWFEGNDAYIKLGYANYYNAYYPLIVQFDLGVGDLPNRNTYDASRDPYSDNPPPIGSGSSGNNGNGGGGSFWGYQVPSSSFNGTLDIPGSSLFPQFLLNAMLFVAIFLPSVFLYRRYWLFPVLVGLLVLSRIGYVFFYVPIVLFTIFVVTLFLREYIAEEYSLLVGLIMGYFINVFIISGNNEYAPEPPSNPLEVPSYLNDLLTKAITFSYLPSPFNMIMTIFFVSLVVFAVIRLIVRIIRGV